MVGGRHRRRDSPFEGPVAERWRALTQEVQRARHAGHASGPNKALLTQEEERGGDRTRIMLGTSSRRLKRDASPSPRPADASVTRRPDRRSPVVDEQDHAEAAARRRNRGLAAPPRTLLLVGRQRSTIAWMFDPGLARGLPAGVRCSRRRETRVPRGVEWVYRATSPLLRSASRSDRRPTPAVSSDRFVRSDE